MLEWILSSTVLIGTVIALRWLFRNRLKMTVRYALWGLVLVRLLLPLSIGKAVISVGNWVDRLTTQPVVQEIVEIQIPVQSQENAYREALEDYRQQGVHVDQLDENTLNYIRQEAATQVEKRPLGDLLTQGAKVLWLVGAAVVAGFFLHANGRFGKALWSSSRDTGLRKGKLPVFTSENLDSPCLFGIRKPAIFVTEEVLNDPTLLRHTLEHEATHHRHGDHIWAVLRGLCLALHWYNPLVWIAAKVSRADAELACDEGALKRLGESERGDYGRTLVSLTCSAPVSDLILTATTMTGSAGSLRERIKLLMKRPRNTVLTVTAVILLVTLTVGCTFSSAPATTQTPETIVPDEVEHLIQTDLTYALPMHRAMEEYADQNPQVLTAEEVTRVREAFTSTVYDAEKDEYFTTAVSAFFTSYYDDVSELDLAEFLRYFPTSGEASEEEFQLLRQKYGADFDWAEHESLQDMPVPVHRYTSEDIDAVTRHYANIPFQEFQNKESVYYLEETSCYYNFTSDFSPGMFTCTKGFVYDGGAILYSHNSALFLTEVAGHYSIKAHLPVIDKHGERSVTEADSFTADGLLVYPGTWWGMTEQELLNELNIQEYGIFSGMRGIHLPTTTFCGYPASIAFYFEEYDNNHVWGLTEVMVRFADEEAANAVCDILTEQLGDSDYETSGVTSFIWQSKIKLEDLVIPEAYAVYQERNEESVHNDGAASTIIWFGKGYTEMENTVVFSSSLHLTRQIEASLTPEFGTVAYFDALLNPQMSRSEADWYPRALTSFYENAGQIDLFQLFYCGIPGADNSITDSEREFLESAPGYDPELDLKRIPVAEMHRVLEEYFGTTLDAVEGVGLENFLYWAKTGCYYLCHSDSNLSFVEIVGCTEVEDGLWHVTYTDWQGKLAVVTMVYSNDTWKILSNTQPA